MDGGVIPNDLSRILDSADIRGIFVNGKTAEKYYQKFSEKMNRQKGSLPSVNQSGKHRMEYGKADRSVV